MPKLLTILHLQLKGDSHPTSAPSHLIFLLDLNWCSQLHLYLSSPGSPVGPLILSAITDARLDCLKETTSSACCQFGSFPKDFPCWALYHTFMLFLKVSEVNLKFWSFFSENHFLDKLDKETAINMFFCLLFLSSFCKIVWCQCYF